MSKPYNLEVIVHCEIPHMYETDYINYTKSTKIVDLTTPQWMSIKYATRKILSDVENEAQSQTFNRPLCKIFDYNIIDELNFK